MGVDKRLSRVSASKAKKTGNVRNAAGKAKGGKAGKANFGVAGKTRGSVGKVSLARVAGLTVPALPQNKKERVKVKRALRRAQAAKEAREKDARANVDPDASAVLVIQLPGERRVKVFANAAVAAHTGLGEGNAGGGVASSKGALLDIRQMYADPRVAHKLPGKYGITLNYAQVTALFAARDDILEAMVAVDRAEQGVCDSEGYGSAGAAADGSRGGTSVSDDAATADVRADGGADGLDNEAAAAEKAARKRARKEKRRAAAAVAAAAVAAAAGDSDNGLDEVDAKHAKKRVKREGAEVARSQSSAIE